MRIPKYIEKENERLRKYLDKAKGSYYLIDEWLNRHGIDTTDATILENIAPDWSGCRGFYDMDEIRKLKPYNK